MSSLIDGMRVVIGRPDLIDSSGALDYAGALEYFGALLILSLTICCIFKLVAKVFVR